MSLIFLIFFLDDDVWIERASERASVSFAFTGEMILLLAFMTYVHRYTILYRILYRFRYIDI